MDWGNAIVRKKNLSPEGDVLSIEADLHLEGDFKKTKKKITWLPELPSSDSSSLPSLVNVTLIDYDYLITKKKLEKDDDVSDFVTPTTEFRSEAFADSNVAEAKEGDIIQFERKGYYIVDKVIGSAETGDLHLDFILIPDGRAGGVASKADTGAATTVTPAPEGALKKEKSATTGGWGKNAPPKSKPVTVAAVPANTSNDGKDRTVLSEGTSGYSIPITTSMYHVDPVVGQAEAKADTKMYQVDPIYHAKSS